jgi:hypothetical protein
MFQFCDIENWQIFKAKVSQILLEKNRKNPQKIPIFWYKTLQKFIPKKKLEKIIFIAGSEVYGLISSQMATALL